MASAAGNGIYSDQGLSGALIQSNKSVTTSTPPSMVVGSAEGVTASGNNSSADGGLRRLHRLRLPGRQQHGVLEQRQRYLFRRCLGSLVQGNRIYKSSFSGIRISGGVSGATVVGNTASGNGDQGISVSSEIAGATNVRYNVANYNKGDGILFSADNRRNIIRFNKAKDNGNFACQDQSTGTGTASTANFWSQNTGVTSSPRGLCKPPTNG